MLSINGLYSFEKAGAKIAPFITGGYSLLFRSGHLNAMNFGGGVDYWFGKRFGIGIFHVYRRTGYEKMGCQVELKTAEGGQRGNRQPQTCRTSARRSIRDISIPEDYSS
ncbi:MAG: hypothetical protein LAP85_11675 [Acidobacteriia bacterium]|nr:hypothetical protein [Terriglobia bacterium]